MSQAMLPSEYEPLKLTPRQQDVHRRYSAMGFKICPRPFAAKDEHLWFFMSLPTAEVPKGIEFTINLQSGIAHRTGTQTIWELEAAEREFCGVPAGERQVVSPPCDSVPVAAAEEKPVAARPVVEKPPAPVKKKQTALF